jgi:hypothetical protein
MLLKFARGRLAKGPMQATNPLTLLGRVLLPELPDLPVRKVELRQFSETNLQSRKFWGAMVGRWMVDATSERVEPEIKPFGENPTGVVHELVPWTIVIHFAYTHDREFCVIEVIEKSGWTERSVYQVTRDINGDVLGPMIGTPYTVKQKRTRSDLCLPEGWTQSQRDGNDDQKN